MFLTEYFIDVGMTVCFQYMLEIIACWSAEVNIMLQAQTFAPGFSMCKYLRILLQTVFVFFNRIYFIVHVGTQTFVEIVSRNFMIFSVIIFFLKGIMENKEDEEVKG